MNTTQAIWAGVPARAVHYNVSGAWGICGQASLSGGPARGSYTKDPQRVTCRKCAKKLGLQAKVEPDLTPF